MDHEFRNQVFKALNLKTTDELIEIWQTNDRTEWSDAAFDVIQEILRNRIGKVPPQGLFRKGLSNSGKIDDLVNILGHENDPMQCLNAAKALAQLGDERGMDYLIAALDIPDPGVNQTAREYLSQLNNRRGNLALKTRPASNIPPHRPGKSEGLNKKYPFLTGYIGFIAIYALISVVIGFIPIPSMISLALQLIAGFYVFKFVVRKNILPYV